MEPTEINESQIPAEPKGMLLSEDAQYFLHQSAKWASFLAIMGYIGCAICALAGIIFGLMFSLIPFPEPVRFPAALGVFMAVIYIGIAIVGFLVSRHLYRYAGNIKMGVEIQSSEHVNTAVSNLHSFFKMKGIILIAALILYVLMIIACIIFAAVGASMLSPASNTYG